MGEQGSPAFNQPLLKRFVNLRGLVPIGRLVRLNAEPTGIDPLKYL